QAEYTLRAIEARTVNSKDQTCKAGLNLQSTSKSRIHRERRVHPRLQRFTRKWPIPGTRADTAAAKTSLRLKEESGIGTTARADGGRGDWRLYVIPATAYNKCWKQPGLKFGRSSAEVYLKPHRLTVCLPIRYLFAIIPHAANRARKMAWGSGNSGSPPPRPGGSRLGMGDGAAWAGAAILCGGL